MMIFGARNGHLALILLIITLCTLISIFLFNESGSDEHYTSISKYPKVFKKYIKLSKIYKFLFK